MSNYIERTIERLADRRCLPLHDRAATVRLLWCIWVFALVNLWGGKLAIHVGIKPLSTQGAIDHGLVSKLATY